jgi:hypothetical protein
MGDWLTKLEFAKAHRGALRRNTREHKPRMLDWVFHPVQTSRAVSLVRMLGKLDEYRRTHGPFFGGEDWLAYQRKLRDEWPD